MRQVATVLLVLPLLQIAKAHSFDDDWFIIETSSPDLVPSPLPSIIPSPLPSIIPSIVSTELPSEARDPRTIPCEVTDSGFYGDETSGNSQARYIRYEYQLEYDQGGNINSILDDLEDAVSNSIIQSASFFPKCIVTNERRRIQSFSSEEIIIGLSSNPTDFVTVTKCPIETIYADTECVVIEGMLTIFYEESNSSHLEIPINELQRIIEEGMGNGSLSMSNENIIELAYLNNSSEGVVDEGLSGRGIDSKPDGSNSLNATNMYLIYATGGVSIILIILTVMKWRSLRHHQVGSDGTQEDRVVISSLGIGVLTDDDSTNFISSKDVSEISLFRKWKMTPQRR